MLCDLTKARADQRRLMTPTLQAAKAPSTMSPMMLTMWSSTMGLVEPVGWPPPAVANGQVAVYIKSSMVDPAIAAGRTAAPKMSATPTPRSPTMNSQSNAATPAIPWNTPWNGPTFTPDRKPVVGDPPLIQAWALGVE